MTRETTKRWAAAATLVALAACSSSSDSTPTLDTSAVVQDLTLDPDGRTTVVSFEDFPGFLGPGAFESDGGQTAQSVSITGATARVVWDERVTPQDRVRVTGVASVPSVWHDVTTTDARQPTFTITGADQDVSDLALGGDTIEVTFTDGPRVVTADAEDPDTWTLTVDTVDLDLSGSTFDLDEATQVLTITLGPEAHLHAAFSLSTDSLTSVADVAVPSAPQVGAATGDVAPPALEGATPVAQNLDEAGDGDDYGRVVEFDFDDVISPVFGTREANFTIVDHPDAVGTTFVSDVEIDATDNTVLRVTFTRPVVPGLDQITVDGVMDHHGNAFPAQTLALVAPSPEANGYTSVDAITREGADNDRIVVVLDQSLDTDTATDPARWTLTLGAPFGAIDLSLQTLSYDMLTRTLTIDLDFDFPNGTTADVVSVGGVDVDGEAFSVAAAQVAASGDATAPTVLAATQRRDVDATGRTYDVTFDEDVDPAVAEVAGHYVFAPAIVVNAATVLADGNTVRLDLAEPAVPGTHTLTVAAALADPAGNTMAAPAVPVLATTDSTAPSAQSVAAFAVEGADNDQVHVTFDDDMVAAEVEDPSNWTLESPVGAAMPLGASSVTYDAVTRVASLTMDAGDLALQREDDLRVGFAAARDVGGNTITAATVDTVVAGELERPRVELVWREDAPNDNVVHVRFDEPSGRLTDLYDASTNPAGTRYAVYDAGAVLRGYPTAAVSEDGGLGVALTFPFTVDLTDTLDVVGVEDLAGNPLFPTLAVVVDAEDATTPVQAGAPVMTAVSGERNDTVVVTFNVPMASWNVADPAHYTLEENGGGAVIDLTGSTFEFDGVSTLTVTLSASAAASLQSGTTYDLTVNVDATDPLRTAQGVAIGGPDPQLAVTVGGDTAAGPTAGGSVAMLDPMDANSILVAFDEAVDETAAETAGGYDYDGGNVAIAAQLLSPRVVRATFGVAVAAGNTVDVGVGSAVDLAGNPAGAVMTLAIVDDQSAPILTGLDAVVVPGLGGDRVEVSFNEQLDLATALVTSNYAVTDSRGAVAVHSASWDSATATVTLRVADLLEGDLVQVSVEDVTDAPGNAPGAPLVLSAAASGDAVDPGLESAFVNLDADPTGLVVDVAFTEEVLTAFVEEPLNWSTDGVASVLDARMDGTDRVRLTLDQAMGASDQLQLAAGLTDPAGNTVAGDLSIDPVE